MQGSGLLSVLVWLPIAGGLAVLALGDGRAALGRWVALATSLAALALSALRGDVDHYRARLQVNLNALRNLPAAAGLPLAAIGFCMGG